MKPIELNLASNPYRNDAPLTVGLVVLALVAIVFTGFNAYAYLTADSTKDRLESQLASHRATMNAMRAESAEIREDLAAVDAEVLGAQASFVSGILAQRNFSWTALLNSLEDVLPWNVRLSIIRPEFGTMGRVTLSLRGTARNVDAFYNFQDALENSRAFSEVLPGNWQYASRDVINDETVEFVLSCRYQQADEPVEGEAEPEQAALPLEGDPVGERIVVEGEPEERSAGADGALLDAEPEIQRAETPSNAAPNRPSAAPSRPSRREAAQGSAGTTPATPKTRAERRAARRAARNAALGGGVAAGSAAGGSAESSGGTTDAGTPKLRSRSGSRTIPGALGGSAGQGSGTRPAAGAQEQAPPAGEDSGLVPGQRPPKDIPKEELMEVDEEGRFKRLKYKPEPKGSGSTGEQGSEQGQEAGSGESGSGASEEGSSGSSGSSSGGSSSGGSSSGGRS